MDANGYEDKKDHVAEYSSYLYLINKHFHLDIRGLI